MPSTPPLLIDLAGVARLAGVQRPVASVWRSRFALSADPFPSPAQRTGDRSFFDAFAVAGWLDRTRHGNNPDAIADAAASAAPSDFDITNATHVEAVDALLSLQAVSGESLAEIAESDLHRLARAFDPDDLHLCTEVMTAGHSWAQWAELLADAAYSPAGASRILERRHVATRAIEGSAGPLRTDAESLLVEVLTTALVGREHGLVLDGASASLASTLASAIESVEFAVLDGRGARAVRRRLCLDGHPLPATTATTATPRLTLLRLPAHPTQPTSDVLEAINDLVLEMPTSDLAIVLAPASVLTDALPHRDEQTRTDALRSGRVRAVVKLPAGFVASAPREALALWVLGEAPDEVPVADRVMAVCDLSDTALTPAARADAASDIAVALGDARDARRHEFRFARLVRTSSILATRGALGVSGRTPKPRRPVRELPALLDQARAQLEGAVPEAAPAAAPVEPLAPASVADLLNDRHLRMLPGTRLQGDEFASSGLTVVGADDLDHPRGIGSRHVDPLSFAMRHPSTRLTEPGDIVFRASPTALAWVDPVGSTVVAHPARVLRVDPADPGGLVPELVAADIARSARGPGAWRRWMLRRVRPDAMADLRGALAELSAQRQTLEDRIDALTRYTDLLSDGVVSGRVILSTPAVPSASDPQ